MEERRTRARRGTRTPAGGASEPRSSGGVQSLSRAFAILEVMADAGGEVGLSQLATETQLPPATIHRLIRTLVDLGYVRQEPSRHYSLGPRLMRLVDAGTKRLATLAHPYLSEVVEALGESVNLAVLDGDEVVDVAQVQPSQNLMRLHREVGRRASPHTTAAGKAILATMSDDEVRELLRRTGMSRRTEHTVTTPKLLLADLERVRERGYALDDGEHERGVRSVGLTVPDASRPMGLSISGPSARMSDTVIDRAVPILSRAAAQLGAELAIPPPRAAEVTHAA